jgi:DNA-directed RNA polymerase subunit K/omega
MSDESAQMETMTGSGAEPVAPPQRMPPIDSRFLFVNVAAHRAKQLRRGALPRLDTLRPDPQTGARPPVGHKLERVAMAEVGEGLIVYEVPAPKPVAREAEA